MKSLCLAIALVLGLLATLAWAAPPAPTEIDTVDRQAIAGNHYTRFIENAFWPTQEVIAAKRVANEVVGPDIEELEVLLRRALKEEFLPSEQDVAAGVVAVEGLRNGNDYLLLRYDTKQYHMQVQRGTALCILVTPKDEARVPLDRVSEYVKTTALALLNIPEKDEAGQEPQVSVSSLDIGASRCGTMIYPASFPPPKHWYSYMRWWSDGRHVLFLTSGWLGDFAELARRAGPPPGGFHPHLFEYKTKQ